jgi:DNA gyrase subunit A
VVKLKDGISLRAAVICRTGSDLALVSDIGRIIKLPVQEDCLPLMGRLAQGPMTMRLFPGEQIAGAISLMATNTILVATAQGRITRIDASQLRRCQRGDLGEIAVNLEHDNDRIQAVCSGDDLVGLITSRKRHGRLDARDFACGKPGEASFEQLDLSSDETLLELIPLIQDKSRS